MFEDNRSRGFDTAKEAEVRNLLASYGEIQDVATVPAPGPPGFILPSWNVHFAYWQHA